MAEATQYIFDHREVVTALLKKQGIHEGIWSLVINFGFGAANVGQNEAEIHPTAMIPVMGVGIQKAESTGPLAVDAAVVNPRTD